MLINLSTQDLEARGSQLQIYTVRLLLIKPKRKNRKQKKHLTHKKFKIVELMLYVIIYFKQNIIKHRNMCTFIYIYI